MNYIEKYTVLFLLIFCSSPVLRSQETVEYPSNDGLIISADFYKTEGSKNYIILFHQAGWSRGEYNEIAPWLVQIGFNCVAVDLRSGNEVNGVNNLTNKRAVEKELPVNYIDALPDIAASVDYVKDKMNPSKILIWGSSYSSSLVLKYAGEHSNSINGVLSFSPGEYFGSGNLITTSARSIEVPVFITSAKNEEKNWRSIFDAIESNEKIFFLPKTKGNHGSRALWSKFDDHEAYRKEVHEFLKKV